MSHLGSSFTLSVVLGNKQTYYTGFKPDVKYYEEKNNDIHRMLLSHFFILKVSYS